MTTYAAPDASGAAGTSAPGGPRLPRLTLFGLVVVVTVVAVEAMAVATVMPTVVRDLHGLRFYSWAFTAYLLADVVGMVDAGRRTDRVGPRPSLLGGLLLFAVGLVVDAVARDMGMLLAGRVLQGLGGGQLIVAVYVVVARAIAADLRPRVFAALSAAWVVPALVGPALAGIVTSAFGWRWVFAGIVPLAVIGVVLLLPVLRSLPAHVEADAADGSGRVRLGPAGASCWPSGSVSCRRPYSRCDGGARCSSLSGLLSGSPRYVGCCRQGRCGYAPGCPPSSCCAGS